MGERVKEATKKADDAGKLWGLRVAEAVVSEVIGALEPEGVLVESGGWDSYCEGLAGWFGGEPTETERVVAFRKGLEYLEAASIEGECMVGAAKNAMSAFVLSVLNPFSPLIDERPPTHNDVDPLLRRAVSLLESGDVTNPDYSVEWDGDLHDRLDKAAEQSVLGRLIETAVRPGSAPSGETE